MLFVFKKKMIFIREAHPSPNLCQIPRDAQRDGYLTKLASQADSMFELFAGEDLKCLCFMEACERRKTRSSQLLMS